MQILLLDPEILTAQVYVRSLEAAGHSVRHVREAQTAVSLADESRPDLVILEINGARHNGIEFLYEFRSYYEWLDIPALVLTSLPATELAARKTLMRELGVREVLAKSRTSLRQLNTRVLAAAGSNVS